MNPEQRKSCRKGRSPGQVKGGQEKPPESRGLKKKPGLNSGAPLEAFAGQADDRAACREGVVYLHRLSP